MEKKTSSDFHGIDCKEKTKHLVTFMTLTIRRRKVSSDVNDIDCKEKTNI